MKRLFVFFCLIVAAAVSAVAQTFPYQNTSLSPQQRSEDLIGRLTLEQKVSLMMNDSPAIPELGIREYNWWNEALHGCARAGLATVFPQSIGMAASWDDALVQKVFDVASDEQRIKYIQYRKGVENPDGTWYHGLDVWTPNINIFRDPRWGRGQETYGEDPYLMFRMGKAVVNGLQGEPRDGYDKLHACLKHYAVHSGPESTRHSFDAKGVSARDLEETYLYAFREIIKETDVQQVMCAYNAVDGRPCCGSEQLLTRILREKIGFKGLVVSDCGAIDDFYRPKGHELYPGDRPSAVSAAVISGTDLECGTSYSNLIEAVRTGKISESQLDVSLLRLFTARFRLGEMDPFDSVPWNRIPESGLACEEHHALALRMARESIVLLQNRNDVLPLKKDARLVVLGPNAADSIAILGNYNGTPRHAVTALEGIKSKFGAENVSQDPSFSDLVIYVGGITPQLEGEEGQYDYNMEGFFGGDRTTIELPRVQREEVKELAAQGKTVIFVNMSGSAMGLSCEAGICPALLQAWYGGECAGEAIADVLAGDFNPSGKLPLTFYRSDSDLPDFSDYDMSGRTYRYFKGTPLWAFGHGLSYTTFKYSGACCRDGVFSVKVSNTGSVDGAEVVQLYVRYEGDAEGPAKALRGFARVSIPAGKSAVVKIPLDERTFQTFNPKTCAMEVLPGEYTLYYGGSSDNVKSLKIKK